MSTITFKNVSSDTLGIMINRVVVPPSSQEDYQMISIPGRLEPLRSNLKTRPPIMITAEATIVDNTLRQIYSTFQGVGQLIISAEPDKYYNASAQVITPDNIARYMNKITLGFECQPFAYAVDNEPIDLKNEGLNAASIKIGGSYYCQPIYQITGSGDITLRVNGASPLTLYNVDGYVTVDTTLMMCHKNGVNVVSSGKLPFMSPGTNMISWSSNVTKMEVTKNERWL